MPAYPVTALVLRKTKLGEADTIVTLLSSEGAQIRAVAKGVRKTRSRFGARLEPFTVVDLLLHTGRSLEIVTEARTVTSNDAIRSDFDRMTAASVVADLLDKVTAEAEAEPVLFDMSLATLQAIGSASSRELPALVAAFLLKAMSVLGLQPSIMRCARCACAHEGDIAFSSEGGGVLCAVCARMDETAVRISSDVRTALHGLLSARMADVAAMEMPDEVAGECLRLLRPFVVYHVPARLKALQFLSDQLASGAWPCVDPPADVG
ncbi:DNA repair protein RecO [Candidatus Micrarchaeota archaeon]|nr:DNA repair protein RecO [Candidatus Micrarchaeota archaeon]